MGSKGTSVIIAVLLFSSGCLEMKNQIREKTSATYQSSIKNCTVDTSNKIAQVSRRLASANVAITSTFCSEAAQYECYRRVFSPKTRNAKTVEQECSDLPELGGRFCLKLSTQYFDTSEAARLPETRSEDLELGGEFNRTEYVCHQRELKDGDLFLTASPGDQLKDSILAAIARCQSVVPRIEAAQMQTGEKP